MYLLRVYTESSSHIKGKLSKINYNILGYHLNFVVPHGIPALWMQCSFVENEATQVEGIRIDDRQNAVWTRLTIYMHILPIISTILGSSL